MSSRAAVLFVRGQGADRSLAEVFAFDAESVVETSPVILPGDGRGKLNQLGIRELLSQAGKKLVRNFHRSSSHGVCVFENEPFQIREIRINAIALQIRNLRGGDAVRPADGRADVNSKRTANQRRSAEFGQAFQFRAHQFAADLRLLHLSVSPEDSGVMGHNLDGHDEPAEFAPGQRVNDSDKDAANDSILIRGRS
jgi:hypothetical protein